MTPVEILKLTRVILAEAKSYPPRLKARASSECHYLAERAITELNKQRRILGLKKL